MFRFRLSLHVNNYNNDNHLAHWCVWGIYYILHYVEENQVLSKSIFYNKEESTKQLCINTIFTVLRFCTDLIRKLSAVDQLPQEE